MKGRRALAPRALALVFASLVALLGFLGVGGLLARQTSRATDPALRTVQALEVVPRELEPGDRLVILGAGFPSGKPARVTLRGTMRRPGERPERGAEVAVAGRAIAGDRVELAFDDAFQALLCGSGDRAAHTTFEGDVEVAFGAAAGGPPVAGVLERVTIDARPTRAGSTREREQDGARALAWMGMEATVAPAGLLVEGVDAASRAQSAGISAGDLVTTFDGVRVASLADLVPPPGEHVATIGVRPARGAAETTRPIHMDGFRRAPPAELVVAAVLVLASLLVVVLFASPAFPFAATLLQPMVARARRRAATARPAMPRGDRVASMLARIVRAGLPPAGPSAAVDAFACGLLAVLPFGQYVVSVRLDVSLFFVAAVTSLSAAATAALVARRSVWRGVRAAFRVTWQHAPAAVAVASAVIATGSVRVRDIERAQGGLPWQWLAFRSPAGLLALGLLLACLCIEPDGATPVPPASALASLVALDDGPRASQRPARGRRPWLDAACRAHRVLVAGLASVLFLGGWLLPGVTAEQQDASAVLELAGAVWLLAKARVVLMAMASARWAAAPWSPSTGPGARATWIWLGPLAVAAFAGTAAWSRWSPGAAEQLLASLSLVATAGLAAAALVHRIRHGARSPAADGHLSPFL
jgi:NADH-quinone oxidoreductase subunit H